MKYSSCEMLKDPKRQIILKFLFDTSHKKKKDSHLGNSTQDLKIHPGQHTYFRIFLKEMELFRVKQRQKISGFKSQLVQHKIFGIAAYNYT